MAMATPPTSGWSARYFWNISSTCFIFSSWAVKYKLHAWVGEESLWWVMKCLLYIEAAVEKMTKMLLLLLLLLNDDFVILMKFYEQEIFDFVPRNLIDDTDKEIWTWIAKTNETESLKHKNKKIKFTPLHRLFSQETKIEE